MDNSTITIGELFWIQ